MVTRLQLNDVGEKDDFIRRIMRYAKEEDARTAAEMERQKREDEKRRLEERKKRDDETRRLEEERRKLEEQKLKDDEKKRRDEEEDDRRIANEIRKLDDERRKNEDELRRCEQSANRRSLERVQGHERRRKLKTDMAWLDKRRDESIKRRVGYDQHRHSTIHAFTDDDDDARYDDDCDDYVVERRSNYDDRRQTGGKFRERNSRVTRRSHFDADNNRNQNNRGENDGGRENEDGNGHRNRDGNAEDVENINANDAEMVSLFRRLMDSTRGPDFTFKDVEESLTKFGGDDGQCIFEWLDEFNDTAKMLRWTKLHKFVYLKRSMKGSARMFIQYECRARNFDDLAHALMTEFGKQINDAAVHKQLSSTRKKSDESAKQYIYRMMKIADQADIDRYTGQNRIHCRRIARRGTRKDLSI